MVRGIKQYIGKKEHIHDQASVGGQVGRSLGNQQTNYMSNNLQTQKVPETMYEVWDSVSNVGTNLYQGISALSRDCT